jgi:hypothetical protein
MLLLEFYVLPYGTYTYHSHPGIGFPYVDVQNPTGHLLKVIVEAVVPDQPEEQDLS